MLAAGLNAGQGTALRIDVPNEPGLVAIEAAWREQSVPLVQDGDWFTVVGIDLDEEARHHVRRRQFSLQVLQVAHGRVHALPGFLGAARRRR